MGKAPPGRGWGFLLHGCRASGFVLHEAGCRVKKGAFLLHEVVAIG